MTANRPANMLARLLLALLFVTIGVQALPSGKLVPELRHGSAFSAQTMEIAIAPRAERGAKASVALPALPPPGTVPVLARALARDSQPAGVPAIAPALPPPAAIATLPYPPRAPPAA